MTEPVRAVLFDMDGLLVDSEPLWTIAEVELAARLGGEWTDAAKAAVIGTRLDVATARILELYDAPRTPADVTAAMGFLLSRMTELFRTELPVMPGALQLVDDVRARGLATALVSSSYRVLVDAALETLDRDRFDVTIAGDELEHGKPHPEAYLTACRRLGVEPAEAIVLEDAMSGITSAEAAGCRVVAVPWLSPIDPAPGRVVVPSLLDLTAAELAASR